MNAFTFSAIRGVQAGRAYYVAMVPLKILGRLFRYDDAELPVKLRAQRDLNKARIPAIARYINDNPAEYVLSALSASIDGAFEFEALEGQRSIGELRVDMAATILINDGQHRRAGILEALRDRPSLGDESIAVTLFPDEGLARSQQMFVDLNQFGVKPARSLRLLYNHRDDLSVVTRKVIENIPLFRDFTDFSRSSLPAGSRKLFTYSSIHSAISLLIKEAGIGPEIVDGDVNDDFCTEFWTLVVRNMPDWQAVGRRQASAAELRRDTVHAHGIALEAIALAGARIYLNQGERWRTGISALREIDWSRSNADLWEGRALVNGRINRSRTSIQLTAELILRSVPQEVADVRMRLR
jgi:DNA sulfur modification protein DndB